MTEPFTPSASTAPCTWASVGWLAKATVSSVPPAKSMPRAKCLVAIETIPGTMTINDRAKNRFRLPVMLSLRGFRSATGAGADAGSTLGSGAPSATMSAPCSSALTSESSDTVHPKQGRAPEAAAGEHDGEQVMSHDDRRDQADDHADGKRLGKALDHGRPDEGEDDAGDDGRRVRVADRGPRPPDRGVDRGRDRAPRPNLFFEAFEDQHVGIDGHTDREDESRDAGEGQGHGHELEHRQHGAGVEDQREARQQPRQPVVHHHEDDDDRQAEEARGDAQLHRLRAQGGAYLRHIKRDEVDWQRA